MADTIKKIVDLFKGDVSENYSQSPDEGKNYLLDTLKFLINAVKEFNETQLTLRAMSLVYTTILSLVPLLAVSFSVLKAFGVHNKVEPFLYNFLAPLGPKGAEMTEKIIDFVNNIKVGVLGSIGLIMLIYTVISLVQKVEESFNAIWKVKQSRTIMRRFSDYLSVILVGPVLIVSALGITASVMSGTIMKKILSIEPFGTAILFAGELIPYFLICLAFTFIYSFVPNTKVNFTSALVGGITGGILWEASGWAFTSFVVSSGKYSAIYSSFAILILFMIWLYFNWLILLFGSFISFCHQYPSALMHKKKSFLSESRMNEERILRIMHLVGKSFYNNSPSWNAASLSHFFKLPIDYIEKLTDILISKGLILETGDSVHPNLLPARDIETITVAEIINIARGIEGGNTSDSNDDEVNSIFLKLDRATEKSLEGETLKDIVIKKQQPGNI